MNLWMVSTSTFASLVLKCYIYNGCMCVCVCGAQTPNHANLQPGEGGLTVWPIHPPTHWNFDDYNTNTNDNVLLRTQALLSQVEPVEVEYSCNRAVLFDSKFFHRSGFSRFKPGHTNRRINFTFLFGYP